MLTLSTHSLSTYSRVLRQHSYETEHTIVDKMGKNSTDHEIPTRLGKMYYFNTILWYKTRIQSPVYSVIWVIDQRRSASRWEDSIVHIDVIGFGTITINEDVVKTADDKVDRSTCPDDGLVGYQLVLVIGNRVKIREPIERWIGSPRPEADGGICQDTENWYVIMMLFASALISFGFFWVYYHQPCCNAACSCTL
jgi:hypothetical protein